MIDAIDYSGELSAAPREFLPESYKAMTQENAHPAPPRPVLTTPQVEVVVAMELPLEAAAFALGLASMPSLHAVKMSLGEDVNSIGRQAGRVVLLLDRCVRESMPSEALTSCEAPALVLVEPQSTFDEEENCSCCHHFPRDGSWNELVVTLKRIARERARPLPGDPKATAGSEPRGAASGFASLTPRERDVLDLIGQGYSVRQCAKSLGLAESTIGNHKYRMMRKLGVGSSIELLRLALQHGAVDL